MRQLHWSLALAPVVLAGCAAAPPPYPEDLESRIALYSSAAPCCEDPAAFAYAALPAAGTIEFVIGRESPSFEFHSGLSRFAAFRLPDTRQPFKVQVKSFFDGPRAPDGTVFYPVLAVMDESFIVTRVSSPENLRLDQALATPGGEDGLAVVAPFDPNGSQERYLVVFTPAILLGAQPPDWREGDVLTAPTLELIGRRNENIVNPSPFGRLRITVAPAKLPDAG